MPTIEFGRAEIDEAAGIDASCFPDPWSPGDFFIALRPSAVGPRRECFARASVNLCKRVDGYVIASIHSKRIVIERIAVAYEARCKGIGSMLLQDVISQMRYEGPEKVEVDVDERWIQALKFFRNRGFSARQMLDVEGCDYHHFKMAYDYRCSSREIDDLCRKLVAGTAE